VAKGEVVATVDEYLAAQPAPRRAVVQELRETISVAAPGAIESIAYAMPAYRLDGRFLVSFAAFTKHYSLFPASAVVIDRLGDELTPYLAGKATLRFPAGEPIPFGLVSRIVAIRVEELATSAEG
jgi:uncharacterized protein YdhG (YjbR/CyaY superfamily)